MDLKKTHRPVVSALSAIPQIMNKMACNPVQSPRLSDGDAVARTCCDAINITHAAMMERSLRQQIIDLLSEQELNDLEISHAVSIREKEVPGHLEHIIRTLDKGGKKLHITPYTCLSCDYRFTDRKRLQRPGRCPRCQGSHIRMATYRIGPR